jgi:hypothetical protein
MTPEIAALISALHAGNADADLWARYNASVAD